MIESVNAAIRTIGILTRLKSKNMRRVDANTAVVIRLLKGK